MLSKLQLLGSVAPSFCKTQNMQSYAWVDGLQDLYSLSSIAKVGAILLVIQGVKQQGRKRCGIFYKEVISSCDRMRAVE